jgi:hypothetical protein
MTIRKSIETPNWMTVKEPRAVRMVATVVLQEVYAVAKEVAEMFGETAAPPGATGAHGSRYYGGLSSGGGGGGGDPGQRGGGGSGSGLQRGIERLFQKKVQIFGEVLFQRESVVNGILKICFKTFFECVRLRTFSRSGFQQIQVRGVGVWRAARFARRWTVCCSPASFPMLPAGTALERLRL